MSAADTSPLDFPAWITPGAQVVVVSGRHNDTEVTTIDRILTRDIVLTNGARFTKAHAHGREIVRYGTGFSPSTHVYPIEDERAQRALLAHTQRRLKVRLQVAVDDLNRVAADPSSTHAALENGVARVERLARRLGSVTQDARLG